jgi:competence protein ComGC
MQIDLTQIIMAVLTFLFAILMRYVIPNIKAKTNANQMELIRAAVKSAVYAIEQLYKSKPGQEKKQKVIEALAKQGYILDVDNVEEKMDLMIEAFVKELSIEQNN